MSSESARTIWTVLVEASLRATIAVALGALILAIARVRTPGVRHAVWTAITVAMLAMPLLPRALPAVRVAVPQPIDLWTEAPATASIDPVPAMATFVERPGRVSAPSAAPPVTTGPVSLPAPSHPIDWRAALSYLYLAGLVASIVYVAAGWLAMTAIVRRSPAVTLADGSIVHESAIVAAPFTAGVFRPCIILPSGWRTWPEPTLRAVVAHERTHIQRRDPLTALVARINCGVFWFHPLAWWLEARLASAAEFACDETASRACGARAEYAQALVDMADGVRRNGGRLAWQGIAVGGNGQLKDRIERLLTAPPWPATSRGKKALVAAACVLAVSIAAACRPGVQAKELQPDPALAAKRAEQKARTARDYEAIGMTPAQVAALEAAVARNPDDRESREKLLLYYGNFRQYLSKGGLKLDATSLAARRTHILWMTAHHPDVETMASWRLRLYTTGQDPNPDAEGYAQAKRLWLAHLARPDVSVQTLTNAARFFEVADKPLAEAAYLQAEAREPGKWSGELGRLYALTIVGSDASTPNDNLRHFSIAAAHTPYADQIRRKLDESADAKLLGAAGRYLLYAEKFENRDAPGQTIDFDAVALGKKYLERAAALDPGATSAATLLAIRQTQERSWQVFKSLKGVWRPTPEEVAALPETERLDILWRLIGDAFFEGENRIYNNKDMAGGRAAWHRLAIYADDALTIGPRHPEHPEAAQAMFNAHIHLGTVALFDSDVRTALAHLEAAPGVAHPDTKQYAGGIATNRLVRYLLKAGEYDAVARYYDRMARINKQEREVMVASARAIRAGRMPEWYQVVTEGEAGR